MALIAVLYFLQTKMGNGKWIEPRSLSRLRGLIVRVRVVPRRTVVGDIDRRFDNLSGSHHHVKSWKKNGKTNAVRKKLGTLEFN